MSRVDLTFEVNEDSIVFSVSSFYFLFRTEDKKGHLDKNDFRHCYIIFRKYHAESYLIPAMFKVRSQQLQATLTAAFLKGA